VLGHAGVRAYFAEIADVWDELRPYAENVETIDTTTSSSWVAALSEVGAAEPT